jgi:hypothetical protein
MPRSWASLSALKYASGKEPFFVPNCHLKRRAKRPDGIEVELELVGSIEILIPVAINRTLSIYPIGDSVETVTNQLILRVRDLLEAFDPEF